MIFGFFTYPKRLNELFCDAVNVWLILGDNDALEIARNAALTAADRQRGSMILYASTVLLPMRLAFAATGAVPTSVMSEQKVEFGVIEHRLMVLLDKFEELKGASLSNARRAMKRSNRDAVEKGDVKFFRLRYPDFPLWTN